MKLTKIFTIILTFGLINAPLKAWTLGLPQFSLSDNSTRFFVAATTFGIGAFAFRYLKNSTKQEISNRNNQAPVIRPRTQGTDAQVDANRNARDFEKEIKTETIDLLNKKARLYNNLSKTCAASSAACFGAALYCYKSK